MNRKLLVFGTISLSLLLVSAVWQRVQQRQELTAALPGQVRNCVSQRAASICSSILGEPGTPASLVEEFRAECRSQCMNGIKLAGAPETIAQRTHDPEVAPANSVPRSENAQVPVRSSAASPASPAPTGREPPMPNGSPSALEEVARGAREPDSLEKIIAGKEWAFYPQGTTDCGGEMVDGPNGQPVTRPKRLDLPDEEDDFKRRRLASNRAKTAEDTGAIDGVFQWQTTVHVKAKEESHGVALSAYDFRRKSYTVTVSPTSGGWPALGGVPTLTRESFEMETEGDTGLRIGGKKVSVTGSDEMPHYNNTSSLKFAVSVAEDAAESWAAVGVDVEYLVVQRFKGLGYHRVCRTTCMEILGTRVCSPQDVGFGTFYRTEPVGHVIKVADKLVSEKQPTR